MKSTNIINRSTY